jgi:raffinose/stachyose/melibiose transport system permease protein
MARSRPSGWLFVAPALVAYAVFVLWPICLTFWYSLYRWDGIGQSTWVGLNNYARVFTDPDLFDTILNAFKLIFFFSAIPVLLGLAIAATIRRIATSRLALVARTVVFLPQVIPLVAAGIAWSWLMSSTGLVIAALASFDIIYISTQGGPGNATMVPGLEIYYQAFSERQVGVASALAVVLMALVLLCVLPIQWLTREEKP